VQIIQYGLPMGLLSAPAPLAEHVLGSLSLSVCMKQLQNHQIDFYDGESYKELSCIINFNLDRTILFTLPINVYVHIPV
jgi:hypothetical protein